MKMKYTYFLILLVYETNTKFVDKEKVEFCASLSCVNFPNKTVCGLRQEGDGFRLKIFQNECELMEFGCRVEDKDAYGLINLIYCKKTFSNYFNNNNETGTINDIFEPKVSIDLEDRCAANCVSTNDLQEVCGIRNEGPGFKVRWFLSNCELVKYNCLHNLKFNATDPYICGGLDRPTSEKNMDETRVEVDKDVTVTAENNQIDVTEVETESTTKPEGDMSITNDNITDGNAVHKNLVVLDGSMIGYNGNINETMDNFFAATHVFDLPIKDINLHKEEALNEEARRMLIKVFKPVKVYKPWIDIPKKIIVDHWHTPTLSSCYHKCPTACPDTYAPVCGVPGINAREPSLMFKNHCFMDVAQCKMFWDDASSSAISSSYIESSFLICLGDALNGLYRFLPIVRTLQHMGRLKVKGKYKYKIRNMRFFNQLLNREPKLMGK